MVYQEGFAAPIALKFANTTFGAEFETLVPNVVADEWVSVFIPPQHFLDYPSDGFDYDLTDIIQWKFDGNGTLWFDNVYFTTEDVLSTSAEELEDFTVFPNPSNTEWNIRSEETIITNYRVFNAQGSVVISGNPNAHLTQIDASALSTGIYMVHVQTEKGTQVIRLVRD